MPSRAHRCSALAIVLLLTIGHSAGMQTIAWVGMFIDRVQTHSVGDALISILDGSHPCSLCRIARSLAAVEVDAGISSTGGKGAVKAPLKLAPPPPQLWLIDEPGSPPLADRRAQECHWSNTDTLADGYASEPPTPPPRSALS
jgi:hypothetical protein